MVGQPRQLPDDHFSNFNSLKIMTIGKIKRDGRIMTAHKIMTIGDIKRKGRIMTAIKIMTIGEIKREGRIMIHIGKFLPPFFSKEEPAPPNIASPNLQPHPKTLFIFHIFRFFFGK